MLQHAKSSECCTGCGRSIAAGDWKSNVTTMDYAAKPGSYHPLCSPLPADRVSTEYLPAMRPPSAESNPSTSLAVTVQSQNSFRQNLPIIVMIIITSTVIAIGAFERMPYGYYTLLRLFTCLSASVLAMMITEDRWLSLKYMLIGVAILYNPIIPIHLGRKIWFPLNLATIVILAFTIYPITRSRVKSQ